MKLNGITGKGSGKLGSSVFATVAGEQIVRQYNGNVSNPNTEAQVGQRAKFKLASQLATAMSSTIAMPKKGMVSARNQFIKKNMSAIGAEQDADNKVASVALDEIQITNGTIALPAVSIENDTDTEIIASMASDVRSLVNRVVYVCYKVANQNYQLSQSVVVNEAGVDGKFSTTLTKPDADYVVYAYGIIDKDATATAKFYDYTVMDGEDVARLVASRSISTSQFTFTKTSAAYVEVE